MLHQAIIHASGASSATRQAPRLVPPVTLILPPGALRPQGPQGPLKRRNEIIRMEMGTGPLRYTGKR